MPSVGGGTDAPIFADAPGLALKPTPTRDDLARLGIDPNTGPETPAQRQLLDEQARLDAQAAQDQANAAAETARGTANTAASAIRVATNAREADAYRIAAGIAGENVNLEDQATALQAFQQARAVRATVGNQRADVATSGFKEAGTNLSLLRDSISQGHITDALTRLNGSLASAGYRAQQQTANEESIAAQGASDEESAASAGASEASMILARQYADAGVLATSQSANLAVALANSPSTLTPSPLTQQFSAQSPAAGGAGGFTVRPSRSDPLLNRTLVNSGYDAAYANDPFGDKAAAAKQAAQPPAAPITPHYVTDTSGGGGGGGVSSVDTSVDFGGGSDESIP